MTIEELIKQHVTSLRKHYSIGIYPNDVPLMCNECDVENFRFAIKYSLLYEQIKLSDLGILEPFHRASLIGFSTNNANEWFIVDPTYGQFFENEKFRNYMFDNYKEFSLTLLNQGYIKFTNFNMMCYINGFVFSNAYITNIDSNVVYKKIEALLSLNGLVDEETDEIGKKIF